mgnify:CR=1 FL=1
MKDQLPNMNEAQKAAFWGWWSSKEATYTAKDIELLLSRIKQFNAGAVDEYLTNHVDKVYTEWLQERQT